MLLQVSKSTINGLSYIESHETCPIVGVATAFGMLLILEIDEQGEADVIVNYCLTSSKIVYLKFVPNSMALIVVDEENAFFLIKRESNNNDDIKKFLNLHRSYIDYSAVKTNTSMHLLMLYAKNGSKISVTPYSLCEYITIKEDENYSHQVQTIQLSNLYSAIQFQYYDSNKFVLGAKMMDIDLFQCVCFENGKIEFNVMQTINTIHCFSSIKFTVNASSVLTYGDGQILLWDKNSMRMVKSILAHEKCSHGVKDAILDPLQRLNHLSS